MDLMETGWRALGEEEPVPQMLGEFMLFSFNLRAILISCNRRATRETQQLAQFFTSAV